MRAHPRPRVASTPMMLMSRSVTERGALTEPHVRGYTDKARCPSEPRSQSSVLLVGTIEAFDTPKQAEPAAH
jgi:hypothetical protein